MRTRRFWHRYDDRLRPIWVVHEATGRSEQTIRTWAKRLQVTTACDLKTRELLVDAVETARLDLATTRRG